MYTEAVIQWQRTVEPVQEPLTLIEAKAQARIGHDLEDTLIAAYIRTAREAAEDCLGRGLLTQTWKLTLERWYSRIWLPMAAPLQSVTSVKYYDTVGTLQTLAASEYLVNTSSRPGSVERSPTKIFPPLQTDRQSGLIEIVYVVGWTDPADVPERIKQGMRHYVTYLDLDRDGMEMGGTQARDAAESCWQDRVSWSA